MNCKRSTQESVDRAVALEGGKCYREKVSRDCEGDGRDGYRTDRTSLRS